MQQPKTDVGGIDDAIRDLTLLLDDRLTTDFITPWATIVLAVAAVIVAIMSWRTARRANQIIEEHRAEDRAHDEARFRRGVAVNLKEWAADSVWRARFGIFYEFTDPEGKKLAKLGRRLETQLEREGEAEGLRLIKGIRGQIARMSNESAAMSAKEAAKLRHPSRIVGELAKFDPIIEEWALTPESIRSTVDEWDAANAADRRANAEALRRRLDEIKAEEAAKDAER